MVLQPQKLKSYQIKEAGLFYAVQNLPLDWKERVRRKAFNHLRYVESQEPNKIAQVIEETMNKNVFNSLFESLKDL